MCSVGWHVFGSWSWASQIITTLNHFFLISCPLETEGGYGCCAWDNHMMQRRRKKSLNCGLQSSLNPEVWTYFLAHMLTLLFEIWAMFNMSIYNCNSVYMREKKGIIGPLWEILLKYHKCQVLGRKKWIISITGFHYMGTLNVFAKIHGSCGCIIQSGLKCWTDWETYIASLEQSCSFTAWYGGR